MMSSCVVHSDPEILGGMPVFMGTRVPVHTLLDYLEAGDSLDEFLEDFPSVTREQVVAALQLAKQMLSAHGAANPSPHVVGAKNSKHTLGGSIR